MGNSNEDGLFVNDGSFLERFKQLQEQQGASKLLPSSNGQEPTTTSGSQLGISPVKSAANRQGTVVAKTVTQKSSAPTNGKLAFSLKQKSRLAVNVLKMGEEDDEEGDNGHGDDRRAKKQKSDKVFGLSGSTAEQGPPTPSNPEVKKVADKLASFVAKNGRQFENITRQKNPGDTPFRFLFDVNSPDYRYYEHRLTQEEQALKGPEGTGGSNGSTFSRPPPTQQKSFAQQPRMNYSTPASALYSGSQIERSRQPREPSQDNARQAALPTDSVSMMEFYMKKAAQEDLRKPMKQPKDDIALPLPVVAPPERSVRSSPATWAVDEPPEDPPAFPPATQGGVEDPSLAAGKKGHHMGDFIPPEELERFLAKCNDAMAAKAAKATAERAKIQSDNVGHRLLSKMGWKEGEGLGSRKGGRSDPVQAGVVKLNNLGVGAEQPGEVTAEDDIYEQYKKKMMLGYKHRPNPLNNPRKAYY